MEQWEIIKNNPQFQYAIGPQVTGDPNQWWNKLPQDMKDSFINLYGDPSAPVLNQQTTQNEVGPALTGYEDYGPNDFMNAANSANTNAVLQDNRVGPIYSGEEPVLGFQMPQTELSWEDLELPMIQKPITGRGSRGFELLENAGHIAAVENRPMRIYQEYLPGQEWTIDVLLTDKTKVIVPRKRVNVKGGNSTCGKIELNRDIIMFLEMFFQDQSFRGPLCVQMKEDKDGVPKLTEINPRFGGGSIFTTIAGINFIDVILAEKFGDKLELEEPREITITRYWDEMEL